MATMLGCGSNSSRTLDDIKADRRELKALYLTLDGEEVVASRELGDTVVASNKKDIAFRAYICKNPDCTGKGKGDRPFLFVWRDPMYSVNENGELKYDVVPDRAEQFILRGSTIEPTCPECAKHRDSDNETPEVRQEYRDWTAYYVLPKTAQREKELDEEHRLRLVYIKEHRN